MPQVRDVLNAINELAPWDLAESWDNVGLQVGSSNRRIQKIMVALDISKEVIQEGLDNQVDGILVHHPLIFKPLSQVNPDSPVGNYITKLIKNDLFLITAHTNVDKAEKGLNQYLAEILDLNEIEPLEPASRQVYKVVVFTPEDYLVKIREVMTQTGAGVIGEYTGCSFGLKGTGTFKPSSETDPFIGNHGEYTEVTEIRLEMVVEAKALSGVLKAVYSNHPYEEPAVDVYSLENNSNHGLGRIGVLSKPLLLKDLCTVVQERLVAQQLRVAGDLDKTVTKVAICSGSGGSLIKTAIRKNADLYLTGDLDYHDFLNAKESGLAVIDAGHWATEQGFISLLCNYLTKYFKEDKDLTIVPSSTIQAEPYLVLKK